MCISIIAGSKANAQKQTRRQLRRMHSRWLQPKIRLNESIAIEKIR